MTTLYWNNICLLSMLEEQYLSSLSSNSIEIEYFGLGRKMSLLKKIQSEKTNNKSNWDIIISTDTDVFQDNRLISKENNLINLKNFYSINDNKYIQELIHPNGIFMPFIIIPLVIIYNKNLLNKKDIPTSFFELTHLKYKNKFVFGGLHNSAGKSFLKSILFKYGEKNTLKILSNSVKTSMPAAAFKMVHSGQLPLAIVPTIFSNRSEYNHISTIWPEEGAISIPSYICIKKDVSKKTIEYVKNNITCLNFQEELVKRGSIIPTHKNVNNSFFTNSCKLFNPSWKFLNSLDHDYFYKLISL